MTRIALAVISFPMALLAGCGTPLPETRDAGFHPMVYSHHTFTLNQAQALADDECAKYKRQARLIDRTASYVFDCSE